MCFLTHCFREQIYAITSVSYTHLVRTKGFRIFMVMFIFTMFGIQMYQVWGNWNDMGRVFWKMCIRDSP